MNKKEAIEAINDKLKDLKYYSKEMGEVLKSANYFIDELEKQVKKEPKLKAYHVTDEYSFNCLMKELKEKGYKTLASKNLEELTYKVDKFVREYVLFNHEDMKCISFSDFINEGMFDIVEYKKELPKFYAKIKGWEHVEYRPHYWVKAYIRKSWHKELNKPINSNLDTAFPKYKEAYTKEEWGKLGIDDSNADFEEIEGSRHGKYRY